MEEAAAAAVPAPDSSISRRSRPAGPVRVVAAICPGGKGGGSFQVADSSAGVSLLPLQEDRTPRPGAPPPRKEYDYRLDCCYSCKDDDSRNQIFHSEVQPLVDAAFRGTNSCVVACGAVAKTHLIMDQPVGLLTMAMEQILLCSQPIGAAVSVSSYQVLQDTRIFDLLEPKDNEVLVLEDADGRTNLKGLSKVRIKSIQEFADLCCCDTDILKHPAKPSNHLQPRGGHHGFIVYISRFDQDDKECLLAKMNFLDLAGYVDPKGRRCVALPNCNKSLYALMNVVYALNSNQSFIPYRQSKLTRILQDSLCKTNNAVLVACLDEFSSQDIVSILSLASRSSQVVNETCYNLSLGTRSSSKSNVSLSASSKNLSRSLLPSIHQPSSALDKHSQHQFNKSAVKASRTPAANNRSKLEMHSDKKSVSSLSTCTKQRGVKSALNGRKLFCPGTNLSKDHLSSDLRADHPCANLDEACSSHVIDDFVDKTLVGATQSFGKLSNGLEETANSQLLSGIQEPVSSSMQRHVPSSSLYVDHSSTNLEEMCLSDVADDIVNKTPVGATQSSPKLSDRLREISNSLKLLSTRPVRVTEQKLDMVGVQDFHIDLLEPKTPEIHLKSRHAGDSHELFKACSTGIKKTLAKECLTFLNSANKEELKSLKGIGEKRANYILELREESPELFKEIDDLKIIGMNNKEIKTLMSGMVMDL